MLVSEGMLHNDTDMAFFLSTDGVSLWKRSVPLSSDCRIRVVEDLLAPALQINVTRQLLHHTTLHTAMLSSWKDNLRVIN